MSGLITSGHVLGVLIAAFAIWLLLRLLFRVLPARLQTQTRPLPVFSRLPKELGYSAENGTPLHFGMGLGRLGSERTLASLAAMETLNNLAAAAAAYGTPPIVTVGDPTLLPVAEDTLRWAYKRRGTPERYNPTLVRYLADQPVIYAAAAADIVRHENVYGNVLIGSFDEEVSLITHAGETNGLPQSYPAVGHLAIGEEMFAGLAQLTRLPHHLVSLPVQDILRFLVAVMILLAALRIL
jgi:hypothetical protein